MNMKKNNYVLIVRDKSSNSYSPIWYNIAEELCNENDVRMIQIIKNMIHSSFMTAY